MEGSGQGIKIKKWEIHVMCNKHVDHELHVYHLRTEMEGKTYDLYLKVHLDILTKFLHNLIVG